MPSAHLSLGPTSCPNRVTEHECQGSQARDTNTARDGDILAPRPEQPLPTWPSALP